MQATNDNSVCRCILALTQGFQPAFRICEVQPLPESQLQMLRRLEQNPSPAQALCFPRDRARHQLPAGRPWPWTAHKEDLRENNRKSISKGHKQVDSCLARNSSAFSVSCCKPCPTCSFPSLRVTGGRRPAASTHEAPQQLR